MEKNKYNSWLLDGKEFDRVLIERIEDVDNILKIKFKSETDKNGKMFELIFDPYVAFRNMNESYRARTFAEKGGFKTSFFIVENSSWVTWLHEESLGYYADDELIHYAIITGADCFDVISEFPPEVNLLAAT